MEYDAYHLAAFAIGALFIGFFKSTFGAGVGLVLVPFLLFFWPTRFVLGVVAVLLWVSDFLAISLFWRKWEGRLVRIVVPGFCLGIFAGVYFLVHISDFWLRKGIGVACLVFAALQLWRELRGELPAPDVGPAAGLGVGVAGGIVSAMFHSGGLVLSLFYLSQGLRKTAIVATIIATWLFVNPVKVFSFWMGGIVKVNMLLVGAAMAPLSFAGSWIGKRVLGLFSERAFNLTLLGLSALSAAGLLLE